MKDIIKKYKRYKIISNLGLILTSLVLALGINFLVIDGTEIGKNLKASVLNSETNKKSDVFLEKAGNQIVLKNSKDIKSLKSMSLSLIYNPENVKIENISSNLLSVNITNLSNTPGFSTVIISLKSSLDLKSSESIISFKAVKKESKTETINMINATFTDVDEENYELSTSGITF